MPRPDPRTSQGRDPPSAIVVARRELAALCALVLRHCDLETVAASSASEVRELRRANDNAVLVDVSLAGGTSLITALSDGPSPTIALVDLDAGQSSFRAFAAGADQVVRLPFTPDELAVRAAALLRRTGYRVRFSRAASVDGLELNLDEHVRVASRTVRLSPTLNSLLYVLAANAGQVVPRGALQQLVWGLGRDSDRQTVDRTVGQLASALGDHAGGHCVVQLHGNGASLRFSRKS